MTKHIPNLSQAQLSITPSQFDYTLLGRKGIDITGQVFGRLTVIGPHSKNHRHGVKWLCQCECGRQAVVLGSYLRAGDTRSCGCLQAETIVTANTTHGMSAHPIWGVWNAIKMRCLNPNALAYPNYGGRGITVYSEWRNNFTAFYNYISMLEHFGEPGYSLDRINNDGNYEPGNIRYATYKEQALNSRRHYNGANIRGETHHNAKRTAEQVRYIREQAKSGKSRRAIAKEMNITLSNVKAIVSRRTWKHIE